MPSVQVMPTVWPVARKMWAISRVVVVLPLTPVTATIGIRPFSPVGEHHVDDRLADRPGLAGGGLQVHPQARAGVDLDDDASLLLQRPADVADHDVDPGDVEPDDPRGVDGAGGDLGVDLVGHVGGGPAGAQVGVAADQDPVRRPAGTESGV